MTGPEHYREAERLLDNADVIGDQGVTYEYATAVIKVAQVHATLALTAAAAGILIDEAGGRSAAEMRENWRGMVA